jgi:hypothetical protein
MADLKISQLTGATTPLAGTEVLPIVQSSTTKQVSVANLTAGRSFDALGMTLTSTDAGATAAPLLDLYRDSASPAANDIIGEIEFNGEDSAGNKQAYGLIHASILSPTSGAEQGQLHFETATAGALTEKMIIGTTNLVINEIGAVFNMRVEGDADANLFVTDATNDRIGVGTASPATKLDVNGTTTTLTLVETTGAAWTDYTPTITVDAGTIGTPTIVLARYRILGKTLFLQLNVTVSVTSGAPSEIRCTLPDGRVSPNSSLYTTVWVTNNSLSRSGLLRQTTNSYGVQIQDPESVYVWSGSCAFYGSVVLELT